MDPVLWNEKNFKAQEKENCLCISVVTTNSRSGSSHNHFRQSAQCLRSSSEHMRRTGQENLWLLRTIRRPWRCQQNCRQRNKRLEPMRMCLKTCCTIMNENSQIFQIIFNRSNVEKKSASHGARHGNTVEEKGSTNPYWTDS